MSFEAESNFELTRDRSGIPVSFPISGELYENEPIYTDFLKFVGPSGQKITRTGNTAKYAGPGVRQKFVFVYFVLHRK
jgi:hypothetical protein